MANPLFSDAEIANISRLNQRDTAYKNAQSAGKDPFAATAQYDNGYRAPGNNTPRSSGGRPAPMPSSSAQPGKTYMRDENNNIVGEVRSDGTVVPPGSSPANTPTPPMPASYGGATYTPGPANWGSMSQAERTAYGRGISGSSGGSYPPMPQQNNQNYKVTAGMGMGGTPPPMPAMGTPPPATPAPSTPAFPVKTPEAIAAEAKARTDALLAKQTTLAAQTKQGFQTSYDRLQGQTRDNRTLADAAFQRNTNPFSGGTDNQRDMTGRQRTIEDGNAQQDLATRFANVDMSLADYTTANDTQRQQMIDDMTARERAYGMQVDQLALQRRGQDLGQSNADRSFGLQQDQFRHGVSQDSIANNHWQNTFDQGANQWDRTFNQNQSNSERAFNAGRTDATQTQLNADRTFNAGRQDAAANATGYYNPSGMTLDQINKETTANSAAYANASPEQQKQLHDRNVYLKGLLGQTDPTGNGDYTGGNPNGQVGYRTTQGQILDNQAKETAYSHARDLIKDTQYQQTFDYNFKKDGLDFALRRATLDNQITSDQAMRTIQLYNSETSRMSANSSAASAASSAGNAAARLAWDKDPNNPDNLFKQSEIAKNNAPKPKTATSYKTDPNFAADVAHIKSNKEAKSQLDSNAQPFIDEYGYDGYVELRKAAGLN